MLSRRSGACNRVARVAYAGGQLARQVAPPAAEGVDGIRGECTDAARAATAAVSPVAISVGTTCGIKPAAAKLS